MQEEVRFPLRESRFASNVMTIALSAVSFAAVVGLILFQSQQSSSSFNYFASVNLFNLFLVGTPFFILLVLRVRPLFEDFDSTIGSHKALDFVTWWVFAAIVLILLREFSFMVRSLQILLPEAAKVYLLTIAAYAAHVRLKKMGSGSLLSTMSISALPLLLLLFYYVGFASLFQIPETQLLLLFSVGAAITYFNLGATVLSGARPLDNGLTLRDGMRLLGAGKTVRGTAGGIILSTLVGSLTAIGAINGFLVGCFVMSGDLIASFLKRRAKIRSGQPVIFLDQMDCLFLVLFLESSFLLFGFDRASLLVLVMATLCIQIAGNQILFRIGKKSVPW